MQSEPNLHRLHILNQAVKNTKGFTWSWRFINKTRTIIRRRIEQERKIADA